MSAELLEIKNRREQVRAEHHGDRLQVFDDEVGLVFEYLVEERKGVVHLPSGDIGIVADRGAIELEAAEGVRIRSGKDVQVLAAGDVTLGTAGTKGHPSILSLAAEGVSAIGKSFVVKAERGLLNIDRLRSIGKKLETEFEAGDMRFERLRSHADTLHTTAKNAYQQVHETMVTQAGLWRTRVRRMLVMEAQQTTIRSDDDVIIDGREIRLG